MWSHGMYATDQYDSDPGDSFDVAPSAEQLDRERRDRVLSDLTARFARPGVAAVLRRLRLRDAHRIFVAMGRAA